MKAAVLHGKEDLRYEEIDRPEVQKGCVRVQVKAAGICGSDIPRVLGDGAHFFPLVLGHEFSGVIESCAADVTGLAPGTHVVGAPLVPCMTCADCQRGDFSLCKHYSFIGSRQNGAFADEVVLPAQNVVPIDPAIPFSQAAFFEPCTVALHGLRCNSYTGGKNVAVLGCGTIGLFTLQWAKLFGAAQLVAFSRKEETLAHAKALGADETISTDAPDFMEKAMALTGGKGYDYVFETAGAVPTIKMSFALAANKAHICMIGTPTREISFTQKEWELMNRKEFLLTGSWMSYSAPFPGEEWAETARAFATGAMRCDEKMIYRKFPMAQAKEAFDLFRDRSKVSGRVLLVNE